jgi:hypothetical protein
MISLSNIPTKETWANEKNICKKHMLKSIIKKRRNKKEKRKKGYIAMSAYLSNKGERVS